MKRAIAALALAIAPLSLAAQAPADYGPVSADVAEIPYPHPMSTFGFVLYGKDVKMTYMDVKPTGAPVGFNPHRPEAASPCGED